MEVFKTSNKAYEVRILKGIIPVYLDSRLSDAFQRIKELCNNDVVPTLFKLYIDYI